MWPLSDPSISLVANFTSLKQNTEVVELFKETMGKWAVSLDSQGLCDGQDLVHLLTFSLCEVFFREMVVCAEGWQPAPRGAVPASPMSHGACRNGENAESSKEQTQPELEGDRAFGGTKCAGQSLLQPKSHGVGWSRGWGKGYVCKDAMSRGKCVNKLFLFLFCPAQSCWA